MVIHELDFPSPFRLAKICILIESYVSYVEGSKNIEFKLLRVPLLYSIDFNSHKISCNCNLQDISTMDDPKLNLWSRITLEQVLNLELSINSLSNSILSFEYWQRIATVAQAIANNTLSKNLLASYAVDRFRSKFSRVERIKYLLANVIETHVKSPSFCQYNFPGKTRREFSFDTVYLNTRMGLENLKSKQLQFSSFLEKSQKFIGYFLEENKYNACGSIFRERLDYISSFLMLNINQVNDFSFLFCQEEIMKCIYNLTLLFKKTDSALEFNHLFIINKLEFPPPFQFAKLHILIRCEVFSPISDFKFLEIPFTYNIDFNLKKISCDCSWRDIAMPYNLKFDLWDEVSMEQISTLESSFMVPDNGDVFTNTDCWQRIINVTKAIRNQTLSKSLLEFYASLDDKSLD